MSTSEASARCGRGFIVAPGESRFCLEDKGHAPATDHATIYKGARLSWPAVTPA